jgi:stage II sporulation protein D
MARSSLFAAFFATVLLAVVSGGYSSSAAKPRSVREMPGSPTFVISGRGWGHGVGMAQWGAFGFAQKGVSYEDILAHYYRGTTLGPAPLSKVRVFLAQGRSKLSLGSNAPYTVRDGIGQTWHLAAGTLTLGPGLKIQTTDVQQPQQLPGPLTFVPGASPLRFSSTAYRGQLQVSVANGRLRAVNLVGLEAYLYGVVPSEMPKDWLPEALKVQAVAARSYALAVRKTGSWFDLYPDTRSQVYLGIAHEAPSATAAVQATAGQVVLYRGQVATTYFFSSSGGRTASAPEVFPSAQAVPYLVSVNDPYDTISPHHRWGPFVVSASRLKRTLGVRGGLADVTLDMGPSGRVETITGVGTQNESTMRGWDFRRALDLDSTWFRIGVLSLANPDAPVTYGTRVSIDGVARSLPSVRLDRRQPGTAWQPVGPVSPGPGGSLVIKTKPKAPTDYRLVSGLARSRVAHVSVAPLVRFRGLADASTLRGYARPLFPGASVALQRSTGGGWTTIARATIDAGGNFEAHVNLTPGDYRARLAPGHGFVPGVSSTLKVGPA